MAKKIASGWVALLPGNPLPFRRSVRDKSGAAKKTLRFFTDEPLELSADEFSVVRNEIGRTLCIVNPRAKSPGQFDVDWEGTNAILRDCHGVEIPKRSRSIVQSGRPTPAQPPQVNDDEDLIEITALIDAGIDEEVAEVLADNIDNPEGGDWVLDPTQIRSKLSAGFDLTKLKGVGEATALKIKTALK